MCGKCPSRCAEIQNSTIKRMCNVSKQGARIVTPDIAKTGGVQLPEMSKSAHPQNFFRCSNLRHRAVAKRRNVSFVDHFCGPTMRRIATPVFGRVSMSAPLQNFAKSRLQCEKTGYMMRSSMRSKRLSFGRFDRPWGPTFSPCFSDAGTNNGVEESLSNYSIKDLARSRIAFWRWNTPGTLCCVDPSAVTRELSQGMW
jgi:hypothetical protein